MTKLAADTVAIHRLTVRGAGQQRTADGVRDSLQAADWPHVGPDSWVFIRRLQVSGTARQLPRQLLEQTRQHLNTGNHPEQVMRFASLAELLAALLTDLLRGRAGFNWYWRRWAHWFELPVSRAISDILSEHLSLLSSVCARLAQRNGLAAVWLTLTDSDGRQLAAELAGLSGFRLPSVLEIDEWLDSEIESADRRSPSDDQTWAEQLMPRPGLLAHWRTLLQGLNVSDGRHQLALLLICQESAPLLLQKQPAKVLAFLSSYFGSRSLAKPQNLSGQPSLAQKDDLSKPTDHPLQAKALAQGKLANHAGKTRVEEEPVEKSVPNTERDGKNNRQVQQNSVPVHQSFAVSSSGAVELARSPLPGQTSQYPEFAGFHTRQGGLLYLLNMLNRLEMRCLMLEHAETLPSGWAWLYRLGQELQLHEDDALVDFIARQLGLDDSAELGRLPPLPAREQVLSLAQRWYGKIGVWQPELLALTGQIQYSPSHIDLYAPMAAIKLPVRLAGLDINPGWLPWLGRVVSFHYD